MSRVLSIDPGVAFVDALAAGVLAEAGTDPLALGRYTILLPTRRACRALGDGFLRRGGGAAMILPRIAPIGDVEEETVGLGLDDEPPVAAALGLPPPISELRRRLLLAQLVMRRAPPDPDHRAARVEQAAWLAAELAHLIDQVETEELTFDRLADLVPDHFAAHWQETLTFLAIVTEHWPAVLAEEGAADPAARRVAMIRALAAAWQASPPADPVIAAGSTGSIPATADLLAAVAALPAGRVVLPGLDRGLDEESWAALEPSHPQYGMARLLARMEVARADVAPWPAPDFTERPAAPAARAALIAEALRPASTTGRWRGGRALTATEVDFAIREARRVDCPGPGEEARAIALMMRQALESDGRTAALVTPDRELARRVAVELGRWGIAIDDSAGTPLALTPPGTFLRLTAAMAVEGLAPVALLAALKHPLAAGGRAPGTFRGEVREIERALLRGPRPGPGMAGLRAALDGAEDERLAPLGGRAAAARWLDWLEAAVAPFVDRIAAREAALEALVAAHVAMAEALAATAEGPGAERLWRGEAGEAAAEFVADLSRDAAGFPPLPGLAYPGLLESLMAGLVVRPRHGRHPRLFIWGPLEARLQQADLVVLGGLNEGTWPPDPGADPWMSRPMRARFGLPALERRIGLAAHDFAQAFAAPEVVLTRAERVEGAPTVPSRWLLRLDAVLRAAGAEPTLGDAQWLHWQAALDAADKVRPVARPEPKPPVARRPRRISVSRVGLWRRDPYAIYARDVLDLSPLDPIDADPGAAERGTFIHRALDRFLRDQGESLSEDAYDRLVEFGRDAFGPALGRPTVRAFWWPRFLRIARWFVDEERRRRPNLAETRTEVSGSLVIERPAGPFTLTAIADRIDRLAVGGIEIIDYKTGAVPSPKDIREGFEPQLALEAVIAEAGGFGDDLAGTVAALAHWQLAGGAVPGAVKPVGGDLRGLIEEARVGFEDLVARFDDGDTVYWSRPHPGREPRFADYDHLARVKEWSVGGGGDGA